MHCIHLIDKTIILVMLSVTCWIGGCTQHDYKAEADRDVYRIIEGKWDPSFGDKANYRISDTEPMAMDVQAGESLTNYGVLTLAQSVALATARNHAYQRQKEALYVQALNLRLTRHQFDSQFFGGGGAGLNGDEKNEVIGAEANVGFNRLLADGTRIGTRVTMAWVDILSGDLNGGLASLLGVTVVKPLLRGARRDMVLEALTQAERDTLYAIRSFNRFRKTFIVSVITEYYTILKLNQKAIHAARYHQRLVQFYETTQKLVQAGRVRLMELQRIEQDVLLARDNALSTQRAFKEALDEFRLTLSVSGTAQFVLDTQEFTALEQAELVLPDFSEEEVISAALTRRLDVANISDRVMDAQRKIDVAQDRLRAELNLVAQAGLTSSEVGDRALLEPYGNEYGLGLELDLPFDRLAEATDLRKAQIVLTQRQRMYEQVSSKVAVDIRTAYQRLLEATQQHQVQMDALALAQKRLANTTQLVRLDRVSTRRVLSAMSDLHQAQDAHAKALINYVIAMLEFYRDSGILHVKPDGMWKL